MKKTKIFAALSVLLAALLLPTASYAGGWGELVPLGHDCDSWTVVREPTCTEAGEKEGYCKSCNKTVTEMIPAKLHTPSNDYKSDKNEHWHECTACKTKLDVASHIIGADGKCTVCGRNAQTTAAGDVNGDGKINAKDIVLLKKYIANYDYDTGTSTVSVDTVGADMNGDGKINAADIVMLKKYIANYEY